jgi:hypothetical protein
MPRVPNAAPVMRIVADTNTNLQCWIIETGNYPCRVALNVPPRGRVIVSEVV